MSILIKEKTVWDWYVNADDTVIGSRRLELVDINTKQVLCNDYTKCKSDCYDNYRPSFYVLLKTKIKVYIDKVEEAQTVQPVQPVQPTADNILGAMKKSD